MRAEHAIAQAEGCTLSVLAIEFASRASFLPGLPLRLALALENRALRARCESLDRGRPAR
jgi:hypothetical protein